MKVFRSLQVSNLKKFSSEMSKPILSHIKWLNNIMEVTMDSGHTLCPESKMHVFWDAVSKDMVKKVHKL
jgi:hypothetical protein